MSDVSFEALNYITSIVVQTYFETAFNLMICVLITFL